MLSLSKAQPAVRPTEPHASGDLQWRAALRDAIRSADELRKTLGISISATSTSPEPDFPVLVPRGFASRMRHGDPKDPLLMQVLPSQSEAAGEGLPTDAVGDLPSTRQHGLIHKYHGRALLVLAGSCAVNCRYCFRRHYPYDDLPHGESAWEPALQAIESDPTIAEVILSGGDPLVLSDDRLQRLVQRLQESPYLNRLRIHTRLPIVIPERVTEKLCNTLRDSRLKTIVVTHVNHANEIDGSVADAISRLCATGTLLLNQSVLLRRVNDSVEALETLSNRLLDCGVVPYYLHQLDLVPGVQHFETSVERGRELIAQLRERLPGYAVPRYVREEPGRPSKTILA